jgi:uncharacterized protein YraI
MSLKATALALGLAAAFTVGGALPGLAVEAFATTNVNVRECAGTHCDVVDVLRRGERVDVDYCDRAWCAIDHRGPDGFVNANYLSRGYDNDDDYDYYDDDDDFYIVDPRPRRFIRRVDPFFSACVGGPNARFCVYD